MMTQAFYTGLSGIKSTQTGIDVLTDNIANIDTIGFRGYSTEFSSLLETSVVNTNDGISAQHSTIGIGTKVNATSMIEESGTLILSDRSTDLAISGDGWFGIANGDETLYTRAGDFVFNANNDLVTPDGMYVLGTMANNIKDEALTSVVQETLLGDIDTQEYLRFPKSLAYPPEPTQNTSFFGNLGIDEEVRTLGATVIDDQNSKNSLQLIFTKAKQQTPPGTQWDIVATIKSPNSETIYDTQTGVINFDAKGALLSHTLTTIDNNGTQVNIDLGKEYSGIVSTNTPYKPGSSSSDGTVGGDLIGYEINKNAEVIATFTNGMQSSVGKVALYHFQNDQGLNRVAGTRYQESSNSGEAIFFQDKNGKNILGSDIINYKLENSNILMTQSLTELIVLQRSFDANSKSVTTADQLLQKALEMDA